MNDTYRLEFNEKQQVFHLNEGTEKPHGWITIFDHCTVTEYLIFDSYVGRIKKDKLDVEYLLKCKSEVEKFMTNIISNGLQITLNHPK